MPQKPFPFFAKVSDERGHVSDIWKNYLLDTPNAVLETLGFSDWNQNTSYAVNDMVKISGTIYISIQNANQGNNPPVTPLFWDTTTLAQIIRNMLP